MNALNTYPKKKKFVSELLWQLFLDVFMFIFSTLSLRFVWSFLVFLDNGENFSKKESFGFTLVKHMDNNI